MSLIKPSGDGNAEIVAGTRPGVTIISNPDGTMTVATNNLGDGKSVEGTYDPTTPIRDIEEDLESKAGK